MLLVTGATGYLGRALLPALFTVGQPLVTLGRQRYRSDVSHQQLDLADTRHIRPLVAGVSTVVHCAGIAHESAPPALYQRVNVDGTEALASAALDAGCQHFVFISSLNVVPHQIVDPQVSVCQLPPPADSYAASKWRAEQRLEALFQSSDAALTIVRPALIYDRECVANLALLARWLERVPVRLPAVGQRSMICRQDLVATLLRLVADQGSGVQRLAVTDGQCYRLGRIGDALRSRSPVLSVVVPASVLRFAAGLRDFAAGRTAGTSWTGLAGDKWCHPTGQAMGCTPKFRLEDCVSPARQVSA